MPESSWGAFHDLAKLPTWIQYLLMCRSLQNAIEIDNPEETVIFQMTIAEMSLTCLGLLSICRIFPEFTPQANALSDKLCEIGEVQGMLRRDTLDKD